MCCEVPAVQTSSSNEPCFSDPALFPSFRNVSRRKRARTGKDSSKELKLPLFDSTVV